MVNVEFLSSYSKLNRFVRVVRYDSFLTHEYWADDVVNEVAVLNRFVSYLYEGFPLKGEDDHVVEDCLTFEAPTLLDLYQSGFSLRGNSSDDVNVHSQ